MIGVHEPCAPLRSARSIVKKPGQPADRARFRHVRMENLRLPASERAIDSPARAQIAQRRYGPHEIIDLLHVRWSDRNEGRHVSLALGEVAVDQKGVEAACDKAAAEIDRLDGRPAYVQAGDDAGDPPNGSPSGGVRHVT